MIEVIAAALIGFVSAGAANAPVDAAAEAQTQAQAQAQPAAQAPSADADFARLAALEGEWRNAENPASPLRIRFALTAGGTVLQESWFAGERLHSLTLYHRDGGRLAVTHYCPQGNQPTLVQREDGPPLDFIFRSATDLDAAAESYLHALSFDLTGPGRIIRRETYRSSAGDEPSVLVLERTGPQ